MIDSSDCEAIYVFIQAMGSLSMGLACVNLAIRTIAIWKNDRHVVVGLTIIILGHWAIILRDIPIVRAMWDDNQGCIFIDNKHNLVTGIYVYAMGIDFIVMCLMAYKTGIQLNNRTRLIKILVVDGVLYFIIAFLVNLMGVVFSALNLNPIMSVIGVVPATMISTIAACRAVRHLTTFVNRPNRLNIIEISQPISEGVSICGVEQQRSTLAETRPCPCITLPVPVKVLNFLIRFVVLSSLIWDSQIMDGSKSPCSDTSDDTLARSPTGSEFV
ncbi:hypothetical protein PQX77_006198 [Marasmius sp. AFHP31]|nr:hypothetical protein PQX77_006198 [Marasmius sp. AFHP31]